jgi:hypothetical protein
VVGGIFWSAPDTDNAEVAAAAFFIVVWAIQLTPCMCTTELNAPTITFSRLQRVLKAFFWMLPAGQAEFLVKTKPDK